MAHHRLRLDANVESSIRRRVDRYTEINQGHATDDEGELEEAYATANPTVLLRYQAALLLSAHRVMFYYPICNAYICFRNLPLNIFPV